METKNAKVRRLVTNGDYKQALQICKEWNYSDPQDREQLRLGYDCLMYPGFYKSINIDPELQYKEAIRVLQKIYMLR